MAVVVFDSGPRTGESLILDKDKTIFGRHGTCDCSLVHPTVSREHFAIERSGAKFILVDQNSGNGTFANGARVSWVELRNGDKIQAGPFTLTFKSTEEKSQTAASTDVGMNQNINSGWFDERHARIYPREYLEGIEHFNAGRYFDAHEVWEEIWLRSSGDTKMFYQMLIQAAVGLHHYERGNARGARGMYKNVAEKIERLPSFHMSFDLAGFARQFKSFFVELIVNEDESSPPDDKPRPLIRLATGEANG